MQAFSNDDVRITDVNDLVHASHARAQKVAAERLQKGRNADAFLVEKMTDVSQQTAQHVLQSMREHIRGKTRSDNDVIRKMQLAFAQIDKTEAGTFNRDQFGLVLRSYFTINVPENVVDQLYLWFQEAKKADVWKSKLYTGFESDKEFRKFRAKAKRIDAYLCHSVSVDKQSGCVKRKLVVKASKHQKMKVWNENRKKRKSMKEGAKF